MGIVLSFIVAISESIKSVLIKRSAIKFDSLFTAWAWPFTSLLIIIPALIVTGIPTTSMKFWYLVIFKVILFCLSLILYSESVKRTDLSLAIPMLAFTPLVTMIVSYFLSGDEPSLLGISGVLIIILGTYLLNLKKGSSVLDPFKQVLSNKGVLYMLFVAVIYGLTTSIDREAVLNSSPIFYSFIYSALGSLVLLPFLLFKQKRDENKYLTVRNMILMIPLGIATGVVVLTQMYAVKILIAAYVISIKRLSILFSSLLGYIVFKENIKKRVFPIVIMLTGILLIIFS